jgi:hypothetical protein
MERMQAHLVNNSSSSRLAPQIRHAAAAPFQQRQSRRKALRNHLQVTNCLKCAQQLQQLIKVSEQSSNVGQQV